MKETLSLLHSEWLKIQSTKVFRVSLAFMLLLVPVVSWLEGRGFYGGHGFGHFSWNFGSYGISVS